MFGRLVDENGFDPQVFRRKKKATGSHYSKGHEAGMKSVAKRGQSSVVELSLD